MRDHVNIVDVVHHETNVNGVEESSNEMTFLSILLPLEVNHVFHQFSVEDIKFIRLSNSCDDFSVRLGHGGKQVDSVGYLGQDLGT